MSRDAEQVINLKKMKTTIKKKIPLFKFSADKVLREKWIRAVPQKNSKIICNSKVGALRFDTNDFITISTDKRNRCQDSLALMRT